MFLLYNFAVCPRNLVLAGTNQQQNTQPGKNPDITEWINKSKTIGPTIFIQL